MGVVWGLTNYGTRWGLDSKGIFVPRSFRVLPVLKNPDTNGLNQKITLTSFCCVLILLFSLIFTTVNFFRKALNDFISFHFRRFHSRRPIQTFASWKVRSILHGGLSAKSLIMCISGFRQCFFNFSTFL